MTHADSLAIPAEVSSKAALYAHVTDTLGHLLAPGSNDWVTALANSSALLYGSYENYKLWGKKAGKRVNWAGAPCCRSGARSSAHRVRRAPARLLHAPRPVPYVGSPV